MRKLPVLFLIMIPIIMSCETQVNVNPSPDPTAITGTPTPAITSTPEQSPVPTATPSPAESVTPIIESNMAEVIIASPKPTLPPHEALPYAYKGRGSISGTVYDENNIPISDASVILKIYPGSYKENDFFWKYDYYDFVKTNSDGYYEFSGPNGLSVIITSQKEGYTKIIDHIYFSDEVRMISELGFLLTKTPEIEDMKINGNKIRGYDFSKVSGVLISGITPTQIKPEVEIPRFKLESVDNLKIELIFNNQIERKTLEENIFIEALDKSITYSNKTKGSTFQWSNNNKKVTFKLPIEIKSEDTTYRLGFTSPFIDVEGNGTFNNLYLSLQGFTRTQLSENIVFAIGGGQ